MTSRNIDIGWIPYWNLHPHKIELMKRRDLTIQFHPGHPTDVNRMLTEPKIVCAPASAVSLLLNPALEIAAPVGVSSNGPVQSVYLGLNGETTAICDLARQRVAIARDIVKEVLDETGDSFRKAATMIWQELDSLPAPPGEIVPRLKLSSASASGAVLSKMFFRLIFGKGAYETTQLAAQYVHTSVPTLELVIGDDALARRHEFQKIFDLGQLWKLSTGLPFVFALWQTSRREIPDYFTQILLQTAEAAEAKMHVEPCAYHPELLPMAQDGHDIDLSSYWKCINYKIGPREIQGLLLYLCLARPLVRAEIDDHMVVKMLRWRQIAENL